MFNSDERKETEKQRHLDHLIRQAMRIDSDILMQLWKIFDYDYGREIYRMYEEFLTIYNKADALDAAIYYGLKYEGK